MCEASAIFKDNDWRLLVSGQGAALFETRGAPPGLQRKLLHLWDIPDFDSLTTVMAAAADNPSYVTAQELTINEVQNLYVVLRWDNPVGLPDTPVTVFMMETLQVVNNIDARGAFASYMSTAVYDMNKRFGWKILFAGSASTGIIDQYVHIWGLADLTNLESAITAYRGDAKWRAAVTEVATSLWTPRPLACFDASGAAPASPARAG